ncbi:GNAT family N-acetyltransferase [Roseateles sp.]|uniref:GNAT family N-acetyltransferase n=1 Tax=Roseateles sp. TaxID=1971397 RepID=UPI002E06EE7B|nr:GNAT family N-acetyltransferase [Roseateles sp.]HEV6966507.1 GNAT family N-acetyltransferase [Roseateles sp.]
MAIRFATMADLPELIEGASRMHALTRFRTQPFNAQRVASSFTHLLQDRSGKYVFLVAIGANKALVGALIGVMEQQIFTDAYTASIMHIDVLPEARMGGYGVRLVRAYEQWAKNRNAFEISFGLNSGVDTSLASQFVQRIGYRKVGENFIKDGR